MGLVVHGRGLDGKHQPENPDKVGNVGLDYLTCNNDCMICVLTQDLALRSTDIYEMVAKEAEPLNHT